MTIQLSVSVSFRLTVLSALVLLAVCPMFGKRKDDVVVMTNGDKFTGEIKGLQSGELIFKSEYMKDPVQLDWKRVEALQSADTFIVALTDGRRVTGTIHRRPARDDADKEFTIVPAEPEIGVASREVITIQPREGTFWDQLTGSVDYGVGFASGNNSTNSTLNAQVAFNTTKNTLDLATGSQFDSQSNAKDTNRFTFDSQYGRALSTRWIAAGIFSLLKSNQQDLNLRSTYGGGFGRKIIRTDRTTLLVIGGAAYTRESYFDQAGAEPVRDNAESLFGIRFSTFRFKTLNLNSQTFLFPSLTDAGRFRLTSQSNVRIELVRNFFWNFQVYENYDTRPPTNGPKNDLGLSNSVGWTF